VLQAHIAYDTSNLDATKVARRKALIQKLEHAAAVEKLSGKKEMHHKIHFQRGIEKVESVSFFMEELAELNRTISRQVQNIVGPDESRLRGQLSLHGARRFFYSANDEEAAETSGFLIEESEQLHCSRVPCSGSDQSLSNCAEPEVTPNSPMGPPGSILCGNATPEEHVPDVEIGVEKVSTSESRDVVPLDKSIRSAGFMRYDSKSSNLSGSRNSSRRSVGSSGKPTHQIKESIRRSVVSGTKTLSASAAAAGAQAEKIIQSAGDMYVETLKAAGSQLAASAGAVVPMLLTKSEGSPKDAGFVIFTDLYATQTALQMIHHAEP